MYQRACLTTFAVLRDLERTPEIKVGSLLSSYKLQSSGDVMYQSLVQRIGYSEIICGLTYCGKNRQSMFKVFKVGINHAAIVIENVIQNVPGFKVKWSVLHFVATGDT